MTRHPALDAARAFRRLFRQLGIAKPRVLPPVSEATMREAQAWAARMDADRARVLDAVAIPPAARRFFEQSRAARAAFAATKVSSQ